MLMLFVYVFGGAIDTGGGPDEKYVDYLLPGILLITIASGTAYTSYRLFLDLQGGIFERFQSMPIARSATLWAHVLTSLVANLVSLMPLESWRRRWAPLRCGSGLPGSRRSAYWCSSPWP